tara:strand:- start:183659 stop:184405 length:747 start_codon:yes stop_codon:yes gene_type:complete
VRTLVVGDIHGYLDPLKDALDKIEYDPSADRLIFVGDYINGGNQPIEVVDYLLHLKDQAHFKPVFIMGNHDYWFSELLERDLALFHEKKYIKKKYRSWMKKGGDKTYKAYRKANKGTVERHKIFFDQLVDHFIWDNKLAVHAGFDANIGFDKTRKREPHALFWDRSLFKLALKKFGKNNKRTNKFGKKRKPISSFELIYIGHTPTIKYDFDTPRVIGNVINVDQGCKYNGKLTIWDDENGNFVQGCSK